MAAIQKYGIKYPFSSNNNDGMVFDVNDTLKDYIKSEVLHIIFTPKGQKLRDPEFGTDLIKYIFDPKTEDDTLSGIKNEITAQVSKRVPYVSFNDITIYNDEKSDNGIIVMVEYVIKIGNKSELTTVAVKL